MSQLDRIVQRILDARAETSPEGGRQALEWVLEMIQEERAGPQAIGRGILDGTITARRGLKTFEDGSPPAAGGEFVSVPRGTPAEILWEFNGRLLIEVVIKGDQAYAWVNSPYIVHRERLGGVSGPQLTGRLELMLHQAVKETGSYDPAVCLPCVEEQMTGEEIEVAEYFLIWVAARVEAGGHGFGHNLPEIFAQWKAERVAV